eukprot:3878821-Amphidinium_carterae.1
MKHNWNIKSRRCVQSYNAKLVQSALCKLVWEANEEASFTVLPTSTCTPSYPRMIPCEVRLLLHFVCDILKPWSQNFVSARLPSFISIVSMHFPLHATFRDRHTMSRPS